MGIQKFPKVKSNEKEDTFKVPRYKKPPGNSELARRVLGNRNSGRLRSEDVQAILDEERDDTFEEPSQSKNFSEISNHDF